MKEFTCSTCHQTYQSSWTDFDAAKEMLELYPECKNDPTDILCDDCNEKFKKWFSRLTESEKIKMRNEK